MNPTNGNIMRFLNRGLFAASLALLSLLAQAAPTVSLSAPANNAQYLAPATFNVGASATPEAGTTITKVEFYANGALIGTDTASSYSVSWANAPAGSHTLTAVATASDGQSTTSAPRTVTINATNTAPTVSLSAPANNAKYFQPASLTVSASASGVEVNTPISKVEFYANGVLIGTDTASPFSIAWASPPAGTHTLTAVATDNAGGVTTSAARTVIITASDNAPTVSLTAPANAAKYYAPATLPITASASGVEVNTPISSVEFYANGSLIGTVTASPYTFNWANPPAGTYTLTAKATDSAGASTTSAARSITINATNTPPTVSLTAPANAAKYFQPASLTVSASASGVEVNTPITQVEFYANDVLIGTDTASPYSIAWASPPAGTYTLTAKATDSAGGVTTSALRTVTITATDTAPTVSLSAPANNAKYLAPANVTLTASASGVEVNTPITQLEFLANGSVIATLTATPYTFAWTNPPAGTYALTARATDSAGAVGTSAVRTITVSDTNLPPTVSLTAPANNATVQAPIDVVISASVTAPEINDTVARVEFYQGTTLIGTATQSPWQITWVKPAAGVYTLTAKATDGQGATTTSASRKLTVLANQLPGVTLTTPANNQTYTAPATISLAATATDPDGTINRVEFYQGTTLIGTATTAPYTQSWANVPEGSYTLSAKAIDNGGAETYSAQVAITVQSSGPKLYYLHTDHLDTPRVVTDETNKIVWRNLPLNEPFGMNPPEEDPDGDGQNFTMNLRFPGQYFDKETNTNYNYFRDYDPNTGRYVQSDPIGLEGGINTYSYVGGNPMIYVDPRGLDNPSMGPYGPLSGWRSPDIQKFVDALDDNAETRSVGLCARYVRRGLEGGGANTAGHPGSAKDWGSLLEKMGFYPISSANYTPLKGDVVVIPAITGHPDGHIQGYDGTGWVSDFLQGGFWPGQGYRNAQPTTQVYRKF